MAGFSDRNIRNATVGFRIPKANEYRRTATAVYPIVISITSQSCLRRPSVPHRTFLSHSSDPVIHRPGTSPETRDQHIAAFSAGGRRAGSARGPAMTRMARARPCCQRATRAFDHGVHETGGRGAGSAWGRAGQPQMRQTSENAARSRRSRGRLGSRLTGSL